MKILVKKTLLYYTDKYPALSMQLMIWYNEFSKLNFHNFNELKQVCYLIWFGSHKEYDKIEAATISFDTNILDFKTKKP